MDDCNENNQLKYFKKLLYYFSKSRPKLFYCSIFLLLISRYSFLIASILPIKVLLIINTIRVPNYFPEIFLKLEFNHSIFLLTLLSVFIYIIHLIAEKVLKVFSHVSLRIVEKNVKKNVKTIRLAENEVWLIGKTYDLSIDFLSYSTFILLTLIIIFFLHQKLFLFITFLILFITLFLYILMQFKMTKNYIGNNKSSIYPMISNIIFLGSFIFLVYVELYIISYGIFISVITLLLLRLATSYCVNIIICIDFFLKHRLKICKFYDL